MSFSGPECCIDQLQSLPPLAKYGLKILFTLIAESIGRIDGKVILASADAKAEHVNLELLPLPAHVAIRRIPLQYRQYRVADPGILSGSGFCNEIGSRSGLNIKV